MNNLVRIIVFGCLAFIIVFTACTSDDQEGEFRPPGPTVLEYPKTINTSIKSSYAFDSYNYPITISYPEAMNTNKNLPNKLLRFHDCFPISLGALELESGSDSEAVSTTVSFRFTYYEIESTS